MEAWNGDLFRTHLSTKPPAMGVTDSTDFLNAFWDILIPLFLYQPMYNIRNSVDLNLVHWYVI